MDHVNKTLHLSLKQDITILTETIENIEIDEDVRSWMFPTKNWTFVKEFVNANKVFEYGDSELYLELLVDRLYVGLRLLLCYLERKNDLVKRDIVVQKPRQITIGCCFLSLWRTVGIITNEMAEQNNQSITNSRNPVLGRTAKNEKTQTEHVTLDKCDSCATAISCMKNVMHIFEETDGDVSIEKKIRPRIFDITQFGSMLQTAVSVENSLKTLTAKLIEKSRDYEDLHVNLKKLRKEQRDKDGKIIFLEQEVRVYKEQCRKNSGMMASLSKKQEEFAKRESENQKEKLKLNETILKLSESSEIDKMTIKNLKLANQKLSDHFERSLQLQKIYVKKIVGLQNVTRTLEIEQRHICYGFSQFELAIENLNYRLINISKCNSGTELKIKSLNGDCSENIPNMIVRLKEYKENVRGRLLKASINNISNVPVIPKFQIKGNPLEDISRQMEENNEKIRQLNEENSKLQIIISRFKCIRK